MADYRNNNRIIKQSPSRGGLKVMRIVIYRWLPGTPCQGSVWQPEGFLQLADIGVTKILIIRQHFINYAPWQYFNYSAGHSIHQGVIVGGEENNLREGFQAIVEGGY